MNFFSHGRNWGRFRFGGYEKIQIKKKTKIVERDGS